MKNKMNNKIRAGLILFAVYGFIRGFFEMPDFISGLLIGLTLVCYITGFLEMRHDLSEVSGFKKSFLRKLFGKS